MRVLALDTTTRGGSAALVEDHRVIAERAGDESRTHAERLPKELTDLLEAHACSTSDVDLFAVASGPGSFTGLRIGIATIQGLAFVHQRPVVAVSALEALGHIGSLVAAGDASAHRDGAQGPAGDRAPLVAAWMDAHRGEVFAALYEVGEAALFEPGRLIEIDGASVGRPDDVLRRWSEHVAGRDVTVIGDAVPLYLDLARSVASRTLEQPLLAAAIGRLAVARAHAGATTSPAGIQPLYVRRPDAEIARDAQRQRQAERGVETGGR
jgi:tRNA threonylcarbamoyladenosine biosynthesis protein TsaB